MDRRALGAILLMMVIAIAPAIFLKKPPQVETPRQGVSTADTMVTADTAPRGVSAGDTAPRPAADSAPAAVPADTILVRSDLYAYGISTHGGRLVSATLADYRSLAPDDDGRPVQLLPEGGALLGLRLIEGGDTLRLDSWNFTPSATELRVTGPTPLTLTASRGGKTVELTYTFAPDEYRIDVAGRVTGVGSNGALLLVDLGRGMQNTEPDSADNFRALAIVTRARNDDPERLNFSDLEAGAADTLSGPFEWVAVKSKYFVTALFAADSTTARISGVSASAPASAGDNPTTADVRLSLGVPSSGAFDYRLYAGPMEHSRLRAMGHEFDDVNPYGWPGFRTVVRFFAVPVRWLLVWMHDNLNLAYGVVLIVFGILVRIVLWPLNQKAMRSTMAMQAIQPEMKSIQERYKSDPQRQQQEMFKLYKEHGVNPLGGCWPMLLPMPVLFALFFVFQNTIELRGAPFLWITDLSQKDPYYIIPLLMGASMYFLTKIGQQGMEPNPQMKMMMYVMPVMMTVLFATFPSGLNLYYTVSNVASIPQQWLLARERKRRGARVIAEVKTKAPEGEMTSHKKRKRSP